jgi:uncharacterized protein (DUF1499 family)
MMLQLRRVVVMGIFSSILAACAGERPDNLGVKGGLLAACPASPNCVSSQADDSGHRIAPLVIIGEPDAAFARLKLVLGRRADTSVVDESPDYLRVELRTVLFVDDGEFLLDRTQRVIHIRSASRLGYSDLGKNRSRMDQIRKEFSNE